MVNWLNENYGFSMSMMTFVYAVSTGFILWTNRNQNQVSKDSLQKVVQIRLFEKRQVCRSLISKTRGRFHVAVAAEFIEIEIDR